MESVPFVSKTLENIRIEISFPFFDTFYSKQIYKYAMEEIFKLNTGDESMIHFNKKTNLGDLYNIPTDKLLCKTYGLWYPTIKLNCNKKFKDTSIIIRSKGLKTYLKDTNGKEYVFLDFLNDPPCSISKIVLVLDGNLEYYYI